MTCAFHSKSYTFPSYRTGESCLEKKLPGHIWEYMDGYGEKRIILRQILKRSFLWNYIVIYISIHLTYINFLSVTQFWNFFMDGFAKGHSGGHSGLWENRKYLQIKLERSFLRNCFVLCAFHSGGYTSFVTRQRLNTVPVKLKRWYFAVHWRLWWKV